LKNIISEQLTLQCIPPPCTEDFILNVRCCTCKIHTIHAHRCSVAYLFCIKLWIWTWKCTACNKIIPAVSVFRDHRTCLI